MASRALLPTLTDYEADFSAWLGEQAAAVRAGRWAEVDRENVAEELEGLARSDFRALVSSFELIMHHLLKQRLQPERAGRSWEITIMRERLKAHSILADNPSFRARKAEALTKGYRLARLAANRQTRIDLKDFVGECPFDWDDVLPREAA